MKTLLLINRLLVVSKARSGRMLSVSLALLAFFPPLTLHVQTMARVAPGTQVMAAMNGLGGHLHCKSGEVIACDLSLTWLMM